MEFRFWMYEYAMPQPICPSITQHRITTDAYSGAELSPVTMSISLLQTQTKVSEQQIRKVPTKTVVSISPR